MILLLDIMDTLVRDPWNAGLEAHFGMDRDAYRNALDADAWLDFEHGRIGEDEYVARYFRERQAVDKQALIAFLRDTWAWLPGMLELLERLRLRGHRLVGLSNYSCWFAHVDEVLGTSRLLERVFLSCEMGVRKPEAEAFLRPLEALGARPEQCLFVDDQPVNVNAAAALGFDAVRFTGVSELASACRARGLLSGP